MTYRCPLTDLEHILFHAEEAFKSLDTARIFLTGGSGFWGIWLLESLALARADLGLGVEVTVLTRSPDVVRKSHPTLFGLPWLKWQAGDVRDFLFPEGPFSHVIHAATPASEELNRSQPDLMFETIVSGTQRVLECTRQKSAIRYLLASSGAVYHPLPGTVGRMPESGPLWELRVPSPSAYSRGKLEAERLSGLAAFESDFNYVSARGFAFVGPFLPLDKHFAIGNFIRDSLKGGPIRLTGDGTSRRSYLHAADMAAWLWRLLAFGKNGKAYNVGSPIDHSMREVAETVARCAGLSKAVRIERTDGSGVFSSYVPDITLARNELGLDVWIPFEQAVHRTLIWHRQNKVKADP